MTFESNSAKPYIDERIKLATRVFYSEDVITTEKG